LTVFTRMARGTFLAILIATGLAGGAAGQASHPGFVGVDSTNATEGGVAGRRGVEGKASWAIELDTLDLRRKFTIRIILSGTAATTLVLRAADSTPPSPGRYTTLIPGTGVSHGDRRLVRADLAANEGGRERSYLPGGRFLDTLVFEPDAEPSRRWVRGSLHIVATRYGDARAGADQALIVRLVRGSFVASAGPETPELVRVTADMQERVLRRALDGFVIAASGATNADGPADSTRTAARARRFLESRWRAAAHVDSLAADAGSFYVRLRGTHAGVTCDVSSSDEVIRCRRSPSA
jgi:hypothetical protein